MFNTSELARTTLCCPLLTCPLHHACLLFLLINLSSGAYLCYSMHNSFGVATFSLPSWWESARFLLFDFAVSRKAIPRAFFIFLPSRNTSIKRRVPIDVWDWVEVSRFFHASEMNFMSTPLERLDQYGFKAQPFLYA